MTDIERGTQALTYFHNSSLRFQAYENRSFNDLLALYGKKAPIYLDGVGLAINANVLSDAQVKQSMIALATKSQGRVPKDHQDYIKFLGNTAAQINYLDLSASVAKEVASTVVEGAVAAGDSVRTTLSWLTNLLPFLVIGGVIFYIYSFGKNNSTVSKETIDSIKKGAAQAKAAVKARLKKAKA